MFGLKKVKPKAKSPKPTRQRISKDDIQVKILKSASDADLQKLRECGVASQAIDIKQSNHKHQSDLVEYRLRSKTERPINGDDRKTLYDDGDYVILTFPDSQKTVTSSGKSKQSQKYNTLPVQRRSLQQQLQDDQNTYKASMDDIIKNFSSYPSSKENSNQSTVDEDGYEIPLVFRPPVYMTFDSDPGGVFNTKEVSNLTPSHTEDQVATNDIATQKPVDHQDKPTFLYSLSNDSNISWTSAEKLASEKIDIPGKPISSFLASRFETISGESKAIKLSSNTSEISALSSSVVSDNSGYNVWSDSSDFSSDCDCYYHQVAPPDLSGHTSDHDYAIIDEHQYTSASNKTKVKRNQSMKKMMSLMVHGRSKSNDSSKSPTESPSVTPKLHRKNMQEMRTAELGTSTWDTVSTPGILKLESFKELGKNRIVKNDETATRRISR